MTSVSTAVSAPGQNCWRVSRARRAACLIDGDAYFSAFAQAAARARRTLYVAGWDLHSRVRVVRDDSPAGLEGVPAELLPFLLALLERRPGLHVFLLSWDFAPVYALERESFPGRRFGGRHPRLHFHLDDRHAVGGCHHQKLIVCDDRVAFCGGFDLTQARWDTRAHESAAPDRCTPDGEPYGPFHDVQLLVEGDVAADLGELFRARWQAATGETLGSATASAPDREAGAPSSAAAQPRDGDETPWPAGIEADFERCAVAIARTLPALDGDASAVREVERHFLDAIAAARETIYLEHQYATSLTIAEALADRLREPDGPEVVLLQPLQCSGWLEQATMGVARERFFRTLRADDPERLGIYAPVSGERGPVNLHSKVLIVDDTLLRVGSANLSNRSLGLDSECDLVIEAGGRRESSAIRRLRDELVAEHLGVEPAQLREACSRRGSLRAAIEALRSDDGRTLLTLESDAFDARLAHTVLPAEPPFDPSRPPAPEPLLNDDGGSGRRWLRLLLALGALAGLGALVRLTPLGEWVRPAAWLEPSSPWSGPLCFLLVVVASMVMAPITALVVGCALLLGPWEGFLWSIAAALVSSSLSFTFGRWISPRRLADMSDREQRIRSALRRRGLLAVILVRVIPLAPFAMVNLVAGASGIRFRSFLAGTVLVMTPGTAALAASAGPLRDAIADPSLASVVLAAACLALVVALGWGVQRAFLRTSQEVIDEPSDDPVTAADAAAVEATPDPAQG